MSILKTQNQENTGVANREDSRKKEYVPEVDIFRKEQELYLEANLPGVDQDSLNISIEKNILTIVGENKVAEPENFDLKYFEYKVGNYRRSFQLNEEIDTDKIEAVVKNGVLRLKLPIKEPFVKKIAVKSE